MASQQVCASLSRLRNNDRRHRLRLRVSWSCEGIATSKKTECSCCESSLSGCETCVCIYFLTLFTSVVKLGLQFVNVLPVDSNTSPKLSNYLSLIRNSLSSSRSISFLLIDSFFSNSRLPFASAISTFI